MFDEESSMELPQKQGHMYAVMLVGSSIDVLDLFLTMFWCRASDYCRTTRKFELPKAKYLQSRLTNVEREH